MREGECLRGRFLIGRQAGAGAMGFVFQGRDLESGSAVAVKVLRTIGAESLARFSREAAVLATLSAPEVARYVAHGVSENGELYLVMEWIVGESFHDRLQRDPVTFGEIVHVAAIVAKALVALHHHGVIHRDLKPANIMLAAEPGTSSSYPNVKVVDFGVARIAGAGETLTATGDMIGTLAYMSPEQARGAKDLDLRADLFALGAVIFRCIAGVAPFEAGDSMATLLRLGTERAPRIESLVPSTPPRLAKLVAALLEGDPRSRPQDALAVVRELEAVRLELASAADLVPVGLGFQPTVLDRSRSITPRRRWPLIAAGLLVALTGLGVAAALIVPGMLAPSAPKKPKKTVVSAAEAAEVPPVPQPPSVPVPPAPKVPASSKKPFGAWELYKDPAGAFEAKFECAPRYKHTPRQPHAGAIVEQSLTTCDSETGYFAVIVPDVLEGASMGCALANRMNEETVLQMLFCSAVSREKVKMGAFEGDKVLVTCPRRKMQGEIRFLCDATLLESRGRTRAFVVELLRFVEHWDPAEADLFWQSFRPHPLR